MVNLTLNTCVSRWELLVLKGNGDREYVTKGGGCGEIRTTRQFSTAGEAIKYARESGRWTEITGVPSTIQL